MMAKAKKTNMRPEVDGYNTAHAVKVPLWPYLVAPLTCLGLLLFAALVKHFYTVNVEMSFWTGATSMLLGLALVGFTAVASRPRGMVMQMMATANAVIAFAWMMFALAKGPWSLGMVGLWVAGTLWATASAAVYRIMRETRGNTPGDMINGELGEMFEAVKGLKEVGRVGRPKIEGARVTQAIEMKPGASFSEVEQARKALASLYDVPLTAVRTPADPDSERRGEVIVVPVDQLKQPIPDPGLTRAGRSIAEPIELGRAEDGSVVELIFPGDPDKHRNAVGVMGVVGMSGSGKTELLLRLCKEVATRCDSDLIIADARKVGQLPSWVKRAAKSVHGGKEVTLDLLDELEIRVARRAETLGAHGFKQWREGCGIPFETYVIFEANAILMDSNIVDLAESVRSVGMCVVLEMQRATWDRVPTSARSNVTTWVCLGVQAVDDADAALSEDQVAAGASPWKWGNGKPGYFYLRWSGRDEALWSAPCRSYIGDDKRHAMDVAAALDWTDGDRPAGEPAAPEVTAPHRTGNVGQPTEEQEEVERPGVDPDDPPPSTDPSRPIKVPDDLPEDVEFGQTDGERMSPDQAMLCLRQHIYTLACGGKRRQLRPSDPIISEVISRTGMSPGWAYKALQRCSEGPDAVLVKTSRGYYKIRQPEPVAAAQ